MVRGGEEWGGEEAADRVSYRTFMSRQTKRSVNETSLATAGAAHVGLIGLQMALMSLCLNKPHQAFFNSAE